MSITHYHMCLDIRGWLEGHRRMRDYAKMFRHDDGRFMTPHEAKQELYNQLAMGRRVLPFGGNCEGFDYQTGCPGHPEHTADASAVRTEEAD